MGRKKKQENTTQENNEVKITDNQKYNGKVNIRVVRNGKTIQNITKHNEGGIPLFRFLVNCLNGDFSSNGIPNFIQLWDNSGTPKDLISELVPKTSCFVSLNQGIPQVNYQFTIPASLISSSSDPVNIKLLTMYDQSNSASIDKNDNTYYSAKVDLGSDFISISQADLNKSTLFITWSLYITN